jgi:RNA polymerase sigma-70 factor (ECF subfamily)
MTAGRQPAGEALVRLEPDAVDAFYREHFDAVYGLAFARAGGRREDAEDITQETFLTAVARIASFDGRSSLRTWLLGIARNKAHERLRQKGREAKSDGAGRLLEGLSTQDLDEETVSAERTQHAVGAAMAQLPEHYREALYEKYVREKTTNELAQHTRRSFKAVESTLSRARRAFCDALTAVMGRDPEGDEP